MVPTATKLPIHYIQGSSVQHVHTPTYSLRYNEVYLCFIYVTIILTFPIWLLGIVIHPFQTQWVRIQHYLMVII